MTEGKFGSGRQHSSRARVEARVPRPGGRRHRGDPVAGIRSRRLRSDKGEHRDLVLAMSTKLEALIKQEVGVDDGREMPPLAGVNWTIDVKGNQAILD